MNESDEVELALSLMEAQVEVTGVSSVRVKDGQIFMFSRTLVQSLVAQLNDSGQERIMLFVKAGPDLTKGIVQ